MKKVEDRSYGIIPVRQIEDEWQFLIVKHLGGHWSFPKGHAELNESPTQAAERELKEETGLKIKRYFKRYPFNEQYEFFHAGQRIAKTVMYYLAEVEGDLIFQQEELLGAEWFNFGTCCEQLTFARSVQICQQSYEFVSACKAAKLIE
jgi:bis(5'-nucleosidyl)-tetraphosphatase